MPVALLVAGSAAAEPVVGPGTAERLAALGVTRISLLQDPLGVGVVIEGWAFDPANVDEAIRAIFPDSSAAVRILHEIEHVAVVQTVAERRTP